MGDAESPDYTAPADKNIHAMAAAADEHWCETFLRMSRESGGKALFTYRQFNQSIDALADLFSSDRAFPRLGDAGAYVSQIMDAGWPSFVLACWVRETDTILAGRCDGAGRHVRYEPHRAWATLRYRRSEACRELADVFVVSCDTSWTPRFEYS